MKKLRVVQIGTLHPHAYGAFLALTELSDTFELVAIGEPDEKQREILKSDPIYNKYHICDAIEALDMENIDAAVIETDEQELAKYALEAAKRNLHIQLDKPGAATAEEFRSLIDEAKSRNLVLQLGYMYRFNPSVLKAVELADNGQLGKIFSVEAHMSIDIGDAADKTLKKYNGGMTYYLGCHLIDVVHRICGKPKEIIPLNCSSNGADCINFGMVVYKYENGVSFIKTNSKEVNGFLRRQIVVTGDLGSVEIKPIEQFWDVDPMYVLTSAKVLLKKDAKTAHFDHTTTIEFPKYKRYDAMFLNFAELIDGRGTKWCSYDDEISLFELLTASCEG